MKVLTQRQKEILHFIKDFLKDHKYPPTIREIAESFGISIKGSYDHVKALEKKGVIACNSNRSRAIEVREETPPETPGIPVPLLGTVSAGIPLLAEENHEEMLNLPPSLTGRGNAFALRVKGDSMIEAGIHHGDVAVFNQQSHGENGQIVVAMVDEAVTLKRFYKEKNRVRLQSENPAYSPIYTTEVRILGKLVSLIRSYG